MIDIKRLSPKLLAGAALATYTLGVGTVLATSYFTSKKVEERPPCQYVIRNADSDDSHLAFRTAILRVNHISEGVCRPLVSRVIQLEAEGSLTPNDGENLLDCYERADMLDPAHAAAELMAKTFPEEARFPSRLGSYELESGDRVTAERSLQWALRLEADNGIDRLNGALLHNNYAWVLLSHKNPDFEAIDAHSRLALRLDPNECAIVHTRLTYEFAKAINLGADRRDLSNWVDVREPYVQCLMAFESPRFRSPGNTYDLDTISSQVVSTYVMDGLLLQQLDVDADVAAVLAPARKHIRELGTKAFCEQSMGVSDPFVIAGCERTVRQASWYWNQWYGRN